jgi:3-deoxy-D-manno-octulosonate 8-phosphate phosphatase (KDO 8-P phosphatase)
VLTIKVKAKIAPMNVLTRFSPISTFVFDMDGVLTDGSLLVMPDGEWIRRMNIKDGYALQLAIKKGYNVWVITGSSSVPVEKRLNRLGITMVFQQVNDKLALLDKLKVEHGVKTEELMYMGDDVPDLGAMLSAGLSCCPSDACRDVLEIANYVSPIKGGEGCAREVIEKVMRVQGKWLQDISVSST